MSNGVDLSQDPENFIQKSDLPDIQGIILRGYRVEYVRHFILQILQPAAFKQFLGKLVPDEANSGLLTITSSALWPGGKKPDYCLNMGFSYSGLQALDLPPGSIDFGTSQFQFQAFKQGAVVRAPKVDDVGANAPENWVSCLNPTNAPKAHVVLSLYSHTPEQIESFSTTLREMFTAGGAAQALPFGDGSNGAPADYFDGKALYDDRIHFGYKDGISQPNVMGLPPRMPDKQPEVPAWQIVLRNAQKSSKPSYVFPQPAVLTRNGGLAAFRILEQDVAGFDKYSESQQGIDPEYLVAKFCGRWRNGNALATCPTQAGTPLPEDQLGDFDYSDDTNGDKTPIGAHTRRANPRSSEFAPTNPPAHRIVRRAMPYGPQYQADNPDNSPRGLVGYFIGSSLEQQFEFIMKVWLNGENFAGIGANLPKGMDPVLGDNDAQTSSFSFPPNTVSGFERFITTKGGLYCFLPSISAIQWMAQN